MIKMGPKIVGDAYPSHDLRRLFVGPDALYWLLFLLVPRLIRIDIDCQCHVD